MKKGVIGYFLRTIKVNDAVPTLEEAIREVKFDFAAFRINQGRSLNYKFLFCLIYDMNTICHVQPVLMLLVPFTILL